MTKLLDWSKYGEDSPAHTVELFRKQYQCKPQRDGDRRNKVSDQGRKEARRIMRNQKHGAITLTASRLEAGDDE